MFKAPFITAISITILLLTGCIVPGARRERAEIELQRNDSLFVVDEGDFHFQIVLPKNLLIVHEATITLAKNEESLVITCGPQFRLVASIIDATSPSTPNHDGILKHITLDDEMNSSIYKRVLPDGNIHDYGLKQTTSIANTTYRFQTPADGEFALSDALRMLTALATVKL